MTNQYIERFKDWIEWEDRPLTHNMRVFFIGFSLAYGIYFVLRFLGMKQYNDRLFAEYLFIGVTAIVVLYAVEKVTEWYNNDVEQITRENNEMQ